MRAVTPEVQGFVDRDGVKIGYEVYGSGRTAILLGPTIAVVDSKLWKAQVAYLSREFRVITLDPRGNGRSDRPDDPAAYAEELYAEDLVAVLDAVGQDQAVVAGLCNGAWWATIAAARHPDRFTGLVAFAPLARQFAPPYPVRAVHPFEGVLDTTQGWAKFNAEYWRQDYAGFLEFFAAELLPEPHSSKPQEDFVAWGQQTTPDVLIRAQRTPPYPADVKDAEELLRAVRCPVLVIYGTADHCQPWQRVSRYAELTRARMITVEGGGHLLPARAPVAVNHWLRDFARSLVPAPSPLVNATAAPPTRWTRSLQRERRALYLSSPIGLGHARRDLAIADELRRQVPGLRIDWLTQHPVSAFLEQRGERVHPASAWLANESRHVESEAGEHDLHAFQAIRAMDEILVANFMVFDELVRDEPYDVWVGDEAWDVDYFLHENPELKRTAFAWLTDFVGWLPMPSGGDREEALAADYNAEMLAQRARFPRLRDRSLFVGNPDDVVPDAFGPGLPLIREWTERAYDFTGYVTGFDRVDLADRDQLRAELGYRPAEQVCVVTVGGSGVGEHLLRKVVAAFPAAAARIPGLRMVVVTGPRIDPATVPTRPGLEVRGFVPDLHRHLAACDLAIVQGGLTTTMELVAAGRPFIYVPLRNHFEQNRHVRHRLANYGAGRCLPYDELDPDTLAEAMVAELGRPTGYRPVESDGAARAAALIAELL